MKERKETTFVAVLLTHSAISLLRLALRDHALKARSRGEESFAQEHDDLIALLDRAREASRNA